MFFCLPSFHIMPVLLMVTVITISNTLWFVLLMDIAIPIRFPLWFGNVPPKPSSALEPCCIDPPVFISAVLVCMAHYSDCRYQCPVIPRFPFSECLVLPYGNPVILYGHTCLNAPVFLYRWSVTLYSRLSGAMSLYSLISLVAVGALTPK